MVEEQERVGRGLTQENILGDCVPEQIPIASAAELTPRLKKTKPVLF